MRIPSLQTLVATATAAGGMLLGAAYAEDSGIHTIDIGGGVKVIEFGGVIGGKQEGGKQETSVDKALRDYTEVPCFKQQTGIPLYVHHVNDAQVQELLRRAAGIPQKTRQYIKRIGLAPLEVVHSCEGGHGRAFASNFGDIVLSDPEGIDGFLHESGHIHYNNLDAICGSKGAQERLAAEWKAVAGIKYNDAGLIVRDKNGSVGWKAVQAQLDAINATLTAQRKQYATERKEIEMERPKIQAGNDDDALKAFNEKVVAYNALGDTLQAEADRYNALAPKLYGAANGCVTTYAGTALEEDVAETTRVANEITPYRILLDNVDSRYRKKLELLRKYEFITDATYKSIIPSGKE